MKTVIENALSHWKFSKKFLCLGLIALSTLSWVSFKQASNLHNQIEFVQREQDGSEYIDALLKSLSAVQLHRGLSVQLEHATAEQRQHMEQAQQDFDQALKTLSGLAHKHQNKYIKAQDFDQLEQTWKTQLSALNTLSPYERFKQHTKVVEELLNKADEIAATSDLALDPELESYYLIDAVWGKGLHLLESLAETRRLGLELMNKSTDSNEAKLILAKNLGLSEFLSESFGDNIKRVGKHNQAAKPLEETLRNQHQLVQQQNDMVFKHFFQNTEQQENTNAQAYFDLSTQSIKNTLTVIQNSITLYNQLLQQRKQTLTQTLWTDISAGLASALLFFMVSWMVYRNIKTTTQELLKVGEQYSAGDFRQSASVQGSDELAELAKNFNRVGQSLRNLISDVSQQTQTVAGASTQLFNATAELSEQVNQQNEATASAAASIQEMSVSVSSIADYSADALNITQESGQKALLGKQAVNNASKDMTLIAQSTGEVTGMITSLNARSADIANILSTIQEISGQTNLLALNAAIEAARAGENGRGFAVVADEVRTLAERTAKSTVEISNVLSQIETDVNNISSKVNDWKHQADQGVKTTEQAANQIHEIGQNSERVQHEVKGIGDAVKEHSAAATLIAQNVEKIARMSEENSCVSSQISNAARDLRSSANNLLNNIARFKVS